MHNRFTPELSKLRSVLEHLKKTLAHNVPNADQIWVEAYSAVIGDNSSSISGNVADAIPNCV